MVPKYQKNVSGTEDQVISLYGRGMSMRDIHDQLKDLYGIEVSAEMVSEITDRILPEIKEWQSRPLNPICPFIFMDCIHYKVLEDGRILSRAAYIVLGITLDGYKDILSITVGANEISKFRLGTHNDLKNSRVQESCSSVWTGFLALSKPLRRYLYRQKFSVVCSIRSGTHLRISAIMT